MSRFLWKLGGARLPLRVEFGDVPAVEEVGHSLSIINRWTGWTRYPYPVAQHAVLTSYLSEPEFALATLHHDDHECVSGDVSSPLKRELDSRVLEEICERFDRNVACLRDLTEAGLAAVRRADLLATYLEAIHLVRVPREEVDAHFGRMELTDREEGRLRDFGRRLGAQDTDTALYYLLNWQPWRTSRARYIERHWELTLLC